MNPTTTTIAVIGTGVIGNGWIARFLAHGFHVIACDPADGAEEKTRSTVTSLWPKLKENGMHDDASTDKLTFTTDISDAVSDAALIQENVPEREDIKRSVLAQIDALAPAESIIASSTSGYKPTTLQTDCTRHPERVIVAHPFHPVYLLPLVELSGGEQTTRTEMERAQAIYELAGMKPLVMKGEVDGHIADRLMEALWREALHIVNDGHATTEEVDKAIVYGAGLRWALMGPFLTFHLAGGDKGMTHMLEQFGPALKAPWTKLEAPELTSELSEKVIEGTKEQSGDKSVAELEERRDEFLLKLMNLLHDGSYWPAEKVHSHDR
ncbi:3-hydroxyacyl-CoA dehydrogenase NAD-binding domain-containing protein [Marinococcus luteus]|uniref:3-hydroxyacyl-CoA dehydrogenase NAD-binding domain-containing protein n=1 Tax=Marinococcus luteus TaxID=1122204 RepID=UPI002ACC8F6F|nr:3-hydroxyacyl-CoA dehydrogenase NAD-binding domain-containing protein [Marinococcus luteus]MDZ5784191.1 3-hydroxyacyl-CoA dehydrogenase NAD-binding domain-containing protein [Marinococcus luteus]